MIIKYSSPRQLHKMVKIEDAVEIAKMWIKGDEYYINNTGAISNLSSVISTIGWYMISIFFLFEE